MKSKRKKNTKTRNGPGIKGMKDTKERLAYAEMVKQGTPKLWLHSEGIYARLFFILHTSSQ